MIMGFVIYVLGAFFVVQVCTLSLPRQILDSHVLPTSLLRNYTLTPLSTPNLTAPAPPPGLSTHITFFEQTPLNPIEIFIIVIQSMVILVQQPYDAQAFANLVIIGPRRVELGFELLRSVLQYKHVVAALYELSVKMASESRYYRCLATMSVGAVEGGNLTFRPRTPAVHDNHLSLNSTHPVALVEPSPGSRSNLTMGAEDSGSVSDPTDSKFELEYNFDGVRIKAADVFTTILDAIASAAEYDVDAVGAYVNGIGALGDCTINMHGLAGRELSWGHLIRALLILWEEVILRRSLQDSSRPRFEGLDFRLLYDGVRIGEGFLWPLYSVSGREGETAWS